MKNKKITAQQIKKLKKIKVAVFDVDGILTDGHVFWDGEEVGFNRMFNIYDGYGMKVLMEAGIKVGVISGGNSVGLKKRIEQLKLDFGYLGDEDKRHAFLEIKKKYQVEDHEILYMGDELFDIPLLKKCGFSATVPNAPIEVRKIVDYISVRESGRACVREVIDQLRLAKKIFPTIKDFED